MGDTRIFLSGVSCTRISTTIIARRFVSNFRGSCLTRITTHCPSHFFMYKVYRFHGPNCLSRTHRLVTQKFRKVGVPTRHLLLRRKHMELGNRRVVRVFRLVRRGKILLSVSVTSKSARINRLRRMVRRYPGLGITVKRFNVMAHPR